MSITGMVFSLLPALHAGAQDMPLIEQRLLKALQKIDYWDMQEQKDRYTNPFDSLDLANAQFEKLLLRYTAIYPASITYDFKKLRDNHLIIASSEDGNFRIYTWNTLQGGTMRRYKTIFQYKNASGVHAKASIENRWQEQDPPRSPGCFYYQVDAIPVNGKTYYLTQRKYIFTSAYSYYGLKAFSIKETGLDEKAKLIKTTRGLQNEIGYEIDWSSGVNHENTRSLDDAIRYDPEAKAFTIPLVFKNYKITDRRIRYVFNGQYFEKKDIIKEEEE